MDLLLLAWGLTELSESDPPWLAEESQAQERPITPLPASEDPDWLGQEEPSDPVVRPSPLSDEGSGLVFP